MSLCTQQVELKQYYLFKLIFVVQNSAESNFTCTSVSGKI